MTDKFSEEDLAWARKRALMLHRQGAALLAAAAQAMAELDELAWARKAASMDRQSARTAHTRLSASLGELLTHKQQDAAASAIVSGNTRPNGDDPE